MQSERYDNIEYNDEWESIPVVRAEPLTSQYDYDNEEDEDDYEEDYDTYSGQSEGYRSFEDIKPKKTESTPQPVIKLQFLLAFLVLASAFILKNYGGDLYTTVSQWYFDNLNNSLIVTMKSQDENSFDTEKTISATDITEQEKIETKPDNTSTEATDVPKEASTEAPSNEADSENSSEEISTENQITEDETTDQSNEEEDEY